MLRLSHLPSMPDPLVDPKGCEAPHVTGVFRFHLFRYEVRRWPDGTIPDAKWAAEPARTVTSTLARSKTSASAPPTSANKTAGSVPAVCSSETRMAGG